MSALTEAMRRLDRRLALPEPARSRLLLEVAADLRDLQRHHLASGLPPDEAWRRAIEQCELSEEALVQLTRVHGGWLRRLMDGLAPSARSRAEGAAMVVTLLFVVLATGRLALSPGLFALAGPWAWPPLAAAAAAVVLAVPKLYALFLKRDHDPVRLHRRLPVIALLAGLALALGAGGHALRLRAAAAAYADGAAGAAGVFEALLGGSAQLIVAFLCAILAALLWGLLAARLSHIEQTAAAVLLAIDDDAAFPAGPDITQGGDPCCN